MLRNASHLKLWTISLKEFMKGRESAAMCNALTRLKRASTWVLKEHFEVELAVAFTGVYVCLKCKNTGERTRWRRFLGSHLVGVTRVQSVFSNAIGVLDSHLVGVVGILLPTLAFGFSDSRLVECSRRDFANRECDRRMRWPDKVCAH